jgi:nucleotide-binding universal stress UspA family protein
MPSFSSLLVDIDALAVRHPALAQAFDLAARCGARVKVVDVLPDVPARARGFVTRDIEQELLNHRLEELGALDPPSGVEMSSAVLRGRPAAALIREVQESRHDLLVRAHARDLDAKDRPFGAVDMELLRQCPCPVWLVGPSVRHPRRMLAAVHANPDDRSEQALNTRIVELALLLADVEDARLTILQAWEAFGAGTLRGRMTDADLARYCEEARRIASDDFSAFLSAFGTRLSGAVLALENGRPEDVIPAYIRSHQVDLVVMGTVARSGVAGLIMGNTAERVLQRLRGSVVAIKPEGFKSPIAAEPSS